MIKPTDAIATARSLIGTPYSELDCINLIKAVIRRAPGGDPSYTTAGTATLWASINKSGKYKDLVMQQYTLDDPIAGMLAFKGEPWGHDGQPHHVGLVTGEGTVIHSSSVKGMVIESPLTTKENWTLLAIHRLIGIKEGEDMSTDEPGDRVYYRARVATEKGMLNVRAGPGTDNTVIAKLPRGTVVNVMFEYPSGWRYIDEEGILGYVMGSYLERIEEIPEEPVARHTILRCPETGQTIELVGAWEIDHITGGDD